MWRRIYLVLNDIMSAVLKSNKYETCQQKLTTILTNERRVNRQLFLHTCDLSLIFLILIQIIQYYLIQNIFLYNNTSLLFTTHHVCKLRHKLCYFICPFYLVRTCGTRIQIPRNNVEKKKKKKKKKESGSFHVVLVVFT